MGAVEGTGQVLGGAQPQVGVGVAERPDQLGVDEFAFPFGQVISLCRS